MNDSLHRTDTLNPRKDFQVGVTETYWVEFQLLDEQGEALADMPYRATNEATREGMVPEYIGRSNAQGLIRIEGLDPLAVTLQLEAEPFAAELQNRRLRATRPEPRRPGPGNPTPLYGPQRPGFSPIELQARAAGKGYYYLRIGQLCDREPSFTPSLDDSNQAYIFHFPDPDFQGFTLGDGELNRHHVLEVCPFRAWSLVLHHQSEYSLVNAYNLGLMSILAYSNRLESELGGVEEFFYQQCLDLSRTPRVWDNGQIWPCVVSDVPFNDRYSIAKSLDTAKADEPEGHTQFCYAISASQILVAWRGTEIDGFADLRTDLTFRPVESDILVGCANKISCGDLASKGSVHLGFRNAFKVARRIYAYHFEEIIFDNIEGRKIFICGHSLGGALGLIHAASLKNNNPLLYTFGMPRTFTLAAMTSFEKIVHFRHVNDTDLIPSVPPEAALDNYLYDLYGPLGTTMGFAWSMLQLATNSLIKRGDPYCHHGEIAMFFKAEQHLQTRGSDYPAYRNKDGLGAPYHNKIARRLPEKAKLYLVPSLGPDEDQQAEQAQGHLISSLDMVSRAKYFPPLGNPKSGRLLGIGNHFMSEYQPYIHNQLLESINPEREPLLERQGQRQKFELQMKEHAVHIPEDEHSRNRVFLHLQTLMGQALRSTQQLDGGAEALLRFDGVADPLAYYEKVWG
ncbi:lipase family protein [Pseudomonas mandelii]|uniref:lipase family protein n=1 Tax=Pseudomonas mandelii TaxID=75612 RepID=UPI00224B178C|nr:lipase family protein [Pseudomonas mandelii]MCX2900424.1 lipase family protein [Pseudomonas mandelii]